MNWFGSKREHLIGIDISSAVVKIVELSKKEKAIQVNTYAVTPLAAEDIDNKISHAERISNAIDLAIKQSQTKTKYACVAVAGASIKKSVIQLPIDLNEDDMEDYVRQEADKQIEFAIDEMYLDFEVLGVNKENPDMQDVLFAASRQENIIEKIEILKLSGLTVSVVDVDIFAMENMFTMIQSQLTDYDDSQTIAIFDIGATMTTLMVLYQGRHIYDTEQSFGGKQLTEAIQERYQMSFSEAGYAKRHGGLLDNYETDILEPFKAGLVREIQRLLSRFSSSAEVRKINSIVLAGGCASIEGIDELVEKELKVPTIIANPFADMIMSPSIEKGLYNDAPAMVIACGLALRTFD